MYTCHLYGKIRCMYVYFVFKIRVRSVLYKRLRKIHAPFQLLQVIKKHSVTNQLSQLWTVFIFNYYSVILRSNSSAITLCTIRKRQRSVAVTSLNNSPFQWRDRVCKTRSSQTATFVLLVLCEFFVVLLFHVSGVCNLYVHVHVAKHNLRGNRTGKFIFYSYFITNHVKIRAERHFAQLFFQKYS